MTTPYDIVTHATKDIGAATHTAEMVAAYQAAQAAAVAPEAP